MFKFLLKRKTGWGGSGIVGFLSVFFAIIFSFCIFHFFEFDNFFEFLKNNFLLGFIPVFFQITFLIIFELILKKIKNYRENTPYKTYTIKEDNKELEVRDYPTLYMKEYYYNGKLHRENGMAVELYGFHSDCTKHGKGFFCLKSLNNIQKGFFYLNGKKQTYEEFINNIDKVRLQNKALSF
tara:strand:+ start:317 stop:859 length:543 start_codon:yes stop_codon:yes gene_type:complete